MKLFFLALAAAAWADQAGDAYKLMKAGKLDEAYKLAYPLALKGDDSAQYTVGAVLEERDPPKSLAWYERCHKTNGYCALRLGDIHQFGRKGVPKDGPKAAFWYEKAAGLGEPNATKRAADMYLNGRGVKADDAKAFKYAKYAAEDGEALWQHTVGLLYGKGRGVKADQTEAYRWLWAASLQGDAQAKKLVATLDTQLSAVQVETAKRRHREWLERKSRPRP